MATATFYTTSKRHNSTLVPTGGTDIAVNLKGGADLNAPLFVLSSATIPTYSMMKFEGKYYFINKIRNVRDKLYEIECSVDVLATYKANIQAMSAFVLYYNHSNTEICDKRLSTKTSKSISSNEGTFDLLGNATSQTAAIIVNVTGTDSCCSYALTQSEANGLLSNYNNWWNDESQVPPPQLIASITDIAEVLKYTGTAFYYAVKQLFSSNSAAECIRSAIMLPLPKSAISGFPADIYLGQYRTNTYGTKVYDRIYSDGASVNIPWQASDWRRNAPYHELYLYIPYVGLIELSPSDLAGDSAIGVSVSLDITTGDAVFTVRSESHVIGQYNTNMASSYAIGSSNITPFSGATAIGSAALAVATSGTASALAATAGFNGLANTIGGQPSSIGSNTGGASIGLTDKIVCYSVFHDTVVNPHNPASIVGEPYNAVLSLNGVSGYVQTLAASVSGNMTDDEREEINNLMDGGIYIE